MVKSSMLTPRMLTIGAFSCWLCSLALVTAQQNVPPLQPSPRPVVAGHKGSLFVTSENCIACHNGLSTSGGEDISIGTSWRATMMANSSRDPYWQAAVRREITDHPTAAAAIEHECSVCHMPMSHTAELAARRPAKVFEHLPLGQRREEMDLLAADGVSCALCHQIQPDRLGTPESFTGGYVIDTTMPFEKRAVFGPYKIERGQTTIMNSATGLVPTEGLHVRQSELCATCHTLYTTALGPNGQAIGRLPEQVPFLEWQHSDYKETQSCQHCHMPAVQEKTRIASVLGEQREDMSRHTFRGGNFFVLGMLNRYRSELDVAALPAELDREVNGTLQMLREKTARLSIDRAAVAAGTVTVDVTVENLTGHKLPTAYPSRRAWLHVAVRDGGGKAIFESGRLATNGSVDGNDNDADASRFEPHYGEITSAQQVQIYESILGDPGKRVTTGLLSAVDFLKDNRLLPKGFDKATAVQDVAVRGDARSDADFAGGSDHLRYTVGTAGAQGPFTIDAELLYQPIGFRWARSLDSYSAAEPRRFVRYYTEMGGGGAATLARATVTVR
jgi:hypothetical protein